MQMQMNERACEHASPHHPKAHHGFDVHLETMTARANKSPSGHLSRSNLPHVPTQPAVAPRGSSCLPTALFATVDGTGAAAPGTVFADDSCCCCCLA